MIWFCCKWNSLTNARQGLAYITPTVLWKDRCVCVVLQESQVHTGWWSAHFLYSCSLVATGGRQTLWGIVSNVLIIHCDKCHVLCLCMWLVFDARFICKWVENYCPLYEGKLKNKNNFCFREDQLCLPEYPFQGLGSPRTKMNKRLQQGQWKKTSWSRDKMWEDCDWCDEAQYEK